MNPESEAEFERDSDADRDLPPGWFEAHPELRRDTDGDGAVVEEEAFEAQSLNELHSLGTQAQALGLILGHGYHQGQYEILRRQEVQLLSPTEALDYLQQLIAAAEPLVEPAENLADQPADPETPDEEP